MLHSPTDGHSSSKGQSESLHQDASQTPSSADQSITSAITGAQAQRREDADDPVSKTNAADVASLLHRYYDPGEPQSAHRRVRFEIDGHTEKRHKSDAMYTHHVAATLPASDVPQLENVILDTLMWMSGLAGPAEAPQYTRPFGGSAAASTPRTEDLLQQHDVTAENVPQSNTATSHHAFSSSSFDATPRLTTDTPMEVDEKMQTPVQRRIPAPHSSSHEQETRKAAHNSQGTAAGLVLTAQTSPSPTAAPSNSQESTSHRTKRTTILTDMSGSTQQAPSSQPHNNRSVNTALVVGGAQWQHNFAFHAQKILRETHKQVEVIREYQAQAAREAQRAEQLTRSQHVLEGKLAAAEEGRTREQQSHVQTVQELSRQVLELDEVVGSLRRRQRELESQLEAAKAAARDAALRHEAELQVLLAEKNNTTVDNNQHQPQNSEENWKHDRALLMDQLQQWQSKNEALKEEVEACRTRLRHCEESRVESTTQTVEDGETHSDAFNSAESAAVARRGTDAGTQTNPNAPAVEETRDGAQGVSVATPARRSSTTQADTFSPNYPRVHPDALAQQQLREQTLLSQVELLESQVQREAEQRRALQSQMAMLREQNEELREAAMHHKPHTSPDFSLAEDGGGRDFDADKDERAREDQRQQGEKEEKQRAVLREIQTEYEALQRECNALLERQAVQQQQSSQQWAAVYAQLPPLLALAGLSETEIAQFERSKNESSQMNKKSQRSRDSVDEESHDALPTSIVSVLRTLHAKLREQAERHTKNIAQEREAVRLSTLKEALQQAEEENTAHRAALDSTEAQLQEARRELQTWQQRQQVLTQQQQQQETAWQAAMLQVRGVARLVSRALREYAQVLPTTMIDCPLPDAESTDAKQKGKKAEAKEKKKTSLLALASSLAEERVDSTPVAARENDVHVSSSSTEQWYESPKMPSDEEDERGEDNVEASPIEEVLEVADDTPRTLSQLAQATTDTLTAGRRSSDELPPQQPTLVLPPSSQDTTTQRDPPAPTLFPDVEKLRRDLLLLLSAWRGRQTTLLEAQQQWKQRCAVQTTHTAALQEKHAARERHWTQQVRILRSAEQHRLQELETLQRDWTAAQAQQAEKEKRERQEMQTQAARERDSLRQRIRQAEEQAHMAEQALVQTDVECNSLKETVRQLREEKADVDAEQQRMQRRQAELTTHIEDLEVRGEAAQQIESALHALLTISVRALVRLLFQVHQLRYKGAMVEALRGSAEVTVAAVEGVLKVAIRGTGVRDEAASEKQISSAAGVHRDGAFLSSQEVSASALADLQSTLSSSSLLSRWRASAYAVMACHRLQRMCTSSKRNALSSATSSPNLISALAACGIVLSTSLLPKPGCSSSSRVSDAGDDVLPAVHLPSSLELVGPLLRRQRIRDDGAADGSGKGHARKVHFTDVQDSAHNENAERTTTVREGLFELTSAEALLEHLFSAAHLDTQAPCTRALCDGVVAAARASSAVKQNLDTTTRWRRTALRRSAEVPTLANNGDASRQLLELLPRTLKALLQQYLLQMSTTSHEVAELKAIVHKLLDQNHKLVAALETQAFDDETRLAEVTSLTEQLALQQPRVEEVLSLQERIVQSRASLLQERKLRREAEEQLAAMRQEQLALVAREEHLKREVYALNMELSAYTSANVGHASVLSTLQKEREDEGQGRKQGGPTGVAAGQQKLTSRHEPFHTPPPFAEQPTRHVPPSSPPSPASSAVAVKRVDEDDDGVVRTPPSRTTHTNEWEENADVSYYQQLLRSSASAADRRTETQLWYAPRHNIPTLDDLRNHQRPSSKQQQQQQDRYRHAGGAHNAVACAETRDITSALELFVPGVVRQREKSAAAAANSDHDPTPSSALSAERAGASFLYTAANKSVSTPAAPHTPSRPSTTVRVVIAPKQSTDRHPQGSTSRAAAQAFPRDAAAATAESSAPLFQTPPSIITATATSSALSASATGRADFTSTKRGAVAHPLSRAEEQVKREGNPQQPQQHDDQQEERTMGKLNGRRPTVSFVDVAAGGTCVSPAVSSIYPDYNNKSNSSSTPPRPAAHGAAAASMSTPTATVSTTSAVARLARVLATSREGSERSATQPPPEVQLSAQRVGSREDEERASRASGPTYFTPR